MAVEISTDTYDGELEACGHRITFWYDLCGERLAEHEESNLADEAKRRAREMIARDFTSGELNCTMMSLDDRELEFTGWWEIDRD